MPTLDWIGKSKVVNHHLDVPYYMPTRTDLIGIIGINVNAAYHDNSSDIGKLMHDFRCRNSEDMFYGPLRKGVHHFKETEGGRARMSKEIEEYADEKAIISVIDLAKDMKMTDQQIEDYLMKKFNLTRDEAKKYLAPAYV